MPREIPLSQNLVTVVDDDLYPQLSQHRWYAARQKSGKYYAIRSVYRLGSRRARTVYMHREILALTPTDPRKADHIESTKTLVNTRDNLRVATTAENAWNRGPNKNNTSGFKGVSRFGNQWRADIRALGRYVYLGLHPTRELAALAYATAATKLHGPFACC